MLETIREQDILKVWRALKDVLHTASQEEGCKTGCIDRLRHYFREGESDPVSMYKKCFTSYTERYLLPNLIKNYFLIQKLDSLGVLVRCKQIVDVGSGPGSFELAYILWHHIRGRDTGDITITMIDAVEEFLTLFGEIRKRLNCPEKESVKIKMLPELIHGKIPFSQKPDLIVFSNSLIEILRNPCIDSKTFVKSIIDSKAIIGVIDYDYEKTGKLLNEFGEEIQNHFTCIETGPIQKRHRFYNELKLGKLGQMHGSGEMPTELNCANVTFLMSTWISEERQNLFSCAPHALKFVLDYKKAWEHHNIQLLRQIFYDNAIYVEKPDAPPFSGIEDICNYWKKNASTQRDVRFHPVIISYDKNNLSVDWHCRFFRRDLSKWMQLKGIFRAELSNGRAHRFSESFEKELFNSLAKCAF